MKGTLPTWLEHLLGVDTAEAGEGTVWGLDHTWSWAPSITVLFVLATVALIVGVYLREGRTAGQRSALTMAFLRLGTVAIVLFMLAGST